MELLSNFKDFQIIKKIGQGAFGVVYKVNRKIDGKEYALKKVKITNMKEKQKQNALNQIRLLASLNHQFIIGYKQTFFQESSQSLCIVMQYASGGDVLKIINQHKKNKKLIQESQIWKAMIHITLGLKTLHDKKILHRDLKCANIFIDSNGNYKLGDLNVSKVLKSALAHTQTGTPYYASPQVWRDQPYDMKSDMWSLGCVIYEMAALKPPFQGHDLQSLFKKIQLCRYDQIPNIYSNDLKNVINLLIRIKPSSRPSTSQLLKSDYVRKHADIGLELLNAPDQNQLLQTIKYQRNFKLLHQKLPKPNYEDDDIDRYNMKQRVYSASNIRKKSISVTKQQVNKQKIVINQNVNQNKMLLPPKPQNKYNGIPPLKTPQIGNKNQNSRQKSTSRLNIKLPILEQRRGSRASSVDRSLG